MNSTARRSRSDVARDLDDWLDAFDQTPVTPPTRQSAWIVATSWVLIAAPLLWQAAQDTTSRARLFELTSALAIAAAVSLATVWQPAFRWAVALRNKLASEVPPLVGTSPPLDVAGRCGGRSRVKLSWAGTGAGSSGGRYSRSFSPARRLRSSCCVVRRSSTGLPLTRSGVGGHEKLPSDGHEGARWRS